MSPRAMRRAGERQAVKDSKRVQRLAKRAALSSGAALGAVVLFAPAADAATFTVNSLADPGDGTCDADECTLREAIEDADAAAGADVVTFQSGLTGTITLTAGDIEIDDAVSIQGPGADTIAVSGNDNSRIFYADGVDEDEMAVTISGLTLRDGNAFRGGAVSSRDTRLTIADSVLTDNYASNDGGAVFNVEGSFTLTGTTVSDNAADKYGGGLDIEDNDAADVLIRDSRITGNAGNEGGGIMLYDLNRGTDYEADGGQEFGATIQRSTISGNTAADQGGGIYLEDAYYNGGAVTIEDTTIADNDAVNEGGGIFKGGADGNETDKVLTIRNSTASGNSSGTTGGGIYLDDDDDLVTTIANSTIVDNDATTSGGGIYRLGTDDAAGTETVDLSSTIVANNSAPDGDLADNEGPPEGSFVLGFSLVEDPGAATVTESPAGSNITGTDPQLGPLANNGGPTATHAPAAGSPAVDAGAANGLAGDQRGAPRTQDQPDVPNRQGSDATDIGAVELAGPSPTPSPTPTPPQADAQCAGEVATIVAQPGVPTVGTSGRDVIVGTSGADSIRAGSGNDLVCARGGDDDAGGQAGDDRILGEGGDDRVVGDAGRDRLTGAGGVDRVNGGDGRDQLDGGDGRDRMSGADGGDRLLGGDGVDRLSGGSGNDLLSGNAGNDRLAGDGDEDRMFGRGGNDRMSGGSGGDSMTGNSGRDTVSGGTGADRIFGGGGNDSLSGAQGADRLLGDSGNDGLRGGPGRDSLRGGPGRDRLSGGSGSDTCAQDPDDGRGSRC